MSGTVLHYLVTAGPTQEYLDDVRFFGNASSGRFGYELARAALRRGHQVTLISGPTQLAPPRQARLIRVVSALDMLRALEREARRADILVMNAAVSDYRPEHRVAGKIKRRDHSVLTVRLVRNPDLLGTIARWKRRPVLVSFALEARRPVRNALEKLRERDLDFIVLNLPETIGSEAASVRLFDRSGQSTSLGPAKKSEIAGQILRRIEHTISSAH